MIDAWNLEVMARTIYGEARSESFYAKIAVGKVIVNRFNDIRWPSSIALVCLQPYQFSCWNSRDPNREKLVGVPSDDSILNACRIAAEAALTPFTADETGKANHYFTTALIGTEHEPSWYDPAKVTATIGAHTFLKL